jgi:RND superfamily putative drug exporter
VISNAVGKPTSDDLTLPGTDSTRATNLLDRDLPAQANGTVPIVLEAAHGTLTEGANRTAVERTVNSLEANRYVRSAVSPLSPQGAAALSQDQRIAYISLTLTLGPDQLTEDEANEIIAAADPARRAGLAVAAGGYLGQEVSEPSTEQSEAIGIAMAIVVLLYAFGVAAAMPLPIAIAIVSVATGLSLVGLLGNVIEVPSVAATLGTMLGLGVGIDYSLFIVTRHRRLLADGHDPDEAAGRAVATSGSAVLFAGSTVVIALLALLVAGIPLVGALGYSAAIVVAIAVIAALTLLPALLGLLGRRIESLRVPFVGRPHHDDHPHGWLRWAEGIGRHPWIAAVAAIVLMVALALPTFEIRLGQPDTGQLTTATTARQAYDMLGEGFGEGTNGPLLVAVRVRPPADPAAGPEGDPRLAQLESDISSARGVQSVSPPQLDSAGTAAILNVVPTTAPSSEATQNLVDRLRDQVIPSALRGTQMQAYVGGQTAGYIDLGTRIGEKLPLVIAVVVALAFLLLMLAFRSIVVPLTAAAMNLLSVVAAYGVLTAVFELGWGNELIGLDRTIPIVSFVPLLMFAILFGLSMDYQVFLLTRVRERYDETRDNLRSVVEGLAGTARVITSAALIMVAVFASFILNGDPTVKQFGVGLAVAIAIDATIVRCLLVPALVVLIGRANWWFPGPLERALPNLGIEGDEYFRRREAEAG